MDFWCSCVPEMIQTIRAVYLYCIALVSCPSPQKNPTKLWRVMLQNLLRGIPGGPDVGLVQCRRPRFDPWVGKIPWRRMWQPTPVFLPGEFHGQRSQVGYSPWGCKKSDTTERLTCTWWRSVMWRHGSGLPGLCCCSLPLCTDLQWAC